MRKQGSPWIAPSTDSWGIWRCEILPVVGVGLKHNIEHRNKI